MQLAPPEILKCQETRLSPWVSVVERTLVMPGKQEPEVYHSLRQADYISVVALTDDNRVPVIRQFRSALERFTLELPGGLLDDDEAPETAAMRELFEETGLKPIESPILLGKLVPDTGRLENTLWGFAVKVTATSVAEWQSEPGIELLLVPLNELREWILNGNFDHALHIALIGLADMYGFLKGNK